MEIVLALLPGARKTVCTDKLPGKTSLGTSDRTCAHAGNAGSGGRELRRANQFWSDEFHGPWPHGDSKATNVVYKSKTGRARLIDFELVQAKSLPAKSRHAHDLLVFLLDILAIASSQQWLPFALWFLNAYGDPTVLAELTNHLALPNGIAWIWWDLRTSFTNPAKVKQRLKGSETSPPILNITGRL